MCDKLSSADCEFWHEWSLERSMCGRIVMYERVTLYRSIDIVDL